MTIEEKKDALLKAFPDFPGWEEKYRYIIDQGKKLPPLSEEEKRDKFLIEGCMSRAWLLAEYRDGRVHYKGDSEASIVKGILSVLLSVYHDSTPDEILRLAPEFLKDVGIEDHLSMNRRNGLANMCKQIKLFAKVFKMQEAIGQSPA